MFGGLKSFERALALAPLAFALLCFSAGVVSGAAINSSGADGIVVYSASASAAQPSYRNWTYAHANFSSAAALSTHSNTILWTRVAGNPSRDEFLLGTLTSGTLRVHGRVYNASSTSWSAPQSLTATAYTSSEREFDVAYEQVSGDGLVVYENSAASNTNFAYRTWNGAAWSSEQTYNTGGGVQIRWVRLVARPNSDDVMVLTLDNGNRLYAVVWNGTAFDSSTAVVVTTGAQTNAQEEFDFAWEGSSGNGLLVYGVNSGLIDFAYRTYVYATKTWGAQGTFLDLTTPPTASPRFLRLCASPNSNYVGAIFYDSRARVNVRAWNGVGVAAGAPTEESATESNAQARHVNCAFNASGDYALFVFVDAAALALSYVFYTPANNSWSSANLNTAPKTSNFASAAIRHVDFRSNPVSSEKMAVVLDTGLDIRAIRYTSTGWLAPPAGNIPLEGTAACTVATFCASFDWFRYDTPPSLSNLTGANGSNYSLNTQVNFTVNASDNFVVSSVWANLTYPNASNHSLSFTLQSGTGYNSSFSGTSGIGNYYVTVFANDSRGTNANPLAGNFTITDSTPPSVVNVSPSAGALYANGSYFNVSANVTDGTAVSAVLANVTLPSGSVQQVVLALQGAGPTYSYNWTNTAYDGNYSIRVVANDSSGNVNSSVVWNFTVDATPPSVVNVSPADGAQYSVGASFNISANVTDANGVSSVLANVTYPNASVQQVVLALQGAGPTYSFNWTGTFVLGSHSIRVIANDSLGNVNSSVTWTFVVNDSTPPSVVNVSPRAGALYAGGASFNISANVTDGVSVSSVVANVTLPSGSVQQVALALQGAGPTYSYNWTNTAADGNYSIRVVANDSSGNANSSVTWNFSVDAVAPGVVNVSPADGAQYSVGASFNISANVTDANGVSSVLANVTYPNASVAQVVLALQGGGPAYSFNWTGTSSVGAFFVRVIANDSVGNVNSSVVWAFSVNDSAPPSVVNVSPANGAEYALNAQVVVSANVTDDVGVSAVLADVTYPNASVARIVLVNQSNGVTYSYYWNDTANAGNYSIRVIANDTGGNANSSVTWFFRVVDSDAPGVTAVSPNEGAVYGVGASFSISANVTDAGGVSAVLANVTLPSAGVTQVVLSREGGGPAYSFVWTDTFAGGNYSIRFIANDSSNNVNSSVTRNFSVDATPPSVTRVSPADGAVYSVGASFNVSVNATDSSNVSSVLANVTYPNASVAQVALALQGAGPTYYFAWSNASTPGNYSVRAIANDSFGNVNSSVAWTFYVNDSVAPSVINFSPVAGAFYAAGAYFNVSANVTDDVGVASVKANVSYPNSFVQQVSLVREGSGPSYSFNWTDSFTEGNYSIRAIAVDSSGNVNSSVVWNFTVDATPPGVANASPANASHYAFHSNVTVSASVSDSVSGVSVVQANVTLPNGSSALLSLSDGDSDGVYEGVLNATQHGYYYAVFRANDSVGNLNASESVNFSAGDFNSPVVSFVAPVNYFNQSNASAVLVYLASDDVASSLSCSLFVDAVLKQSNPSVVNGSQSSFTQTLSSGLHYWNVSCSDGYNYNSTGVRFITFDSDKPNFISLNYSPSEPALLKPGVNVSVQANVTDNSTSVASVTLQYKLNTSSEYSSVSAPFNALTGFFEAWFNASVAGGYNLRLYAVDSAGNSDYSNLVNVTVAESLSWSRSPSAFPGVGANASANVTLGTIVLNNTADYAFNFTVSSNYSNATFNESFPLELAAGGVASVEVNATAPAVNGVTNVVLTVSASASNRTPNPSSLTTNVTLVVSDDAFLAVTILSAPSSVRRGDVGVTFSANVKNVGAANASNVTALFSVPSGWVVTFGGLNSSVVDELLVNEDFNHSIQVTIPSNETLANFSVNASASGVNASGVDLASLGLVSSDYVSLLVLDLVPETGSGTAGGVTQLAPQTIGSGASPSPFLLPVPPEFVVARGFKRVVESTEFVELTRGRDSSFAVSVTNAFKGYELRDVNLRAEGYLAQRVSFEPESFAAIPFGESRDFVVRVRAPDYLEQSVYELVFYVSGEAVAEQEYYDSDGRRKTLSTIKEFVERRVVVLRVHEVSKEVVVQRGVDAAKAFDEVVAAGFPHEKLARLVDEMNRAIASGDYEAADEIARFVIDSRNAAFEANDLIRGLRARIEDAKRSGLDVSAAERMLALAESAFEREDYVTARQRAGEAEFVALLATTGAFNALRFIETYWPYLLLLVVVGAVVFALAFKRKQVERLTRKIEALDKEEAQVRRLMVDAQSACFVKHEISVASYHERMASLEKRLEQISAKRSVLRSSRLALSTPEQEIERLGVERSRVLSAVKALQSQRYEKNAVSRETYESRMDEYRATLDSIDAGIAFVEAKTARDGLNKNA